MLEIKDLHVSYGGIQALRGVSLTVPEGKIVTLIGANGAGKSTLMRTISGLVKAQSGSILWNGQEVLGKPIDQIVASGIAMSPEGRRVFADLTVVENLKIGAYLRKDKAETEKDLEWVYSLFPRLKERSWQSAGTLSGGEQQMLAVGRALMSKPRLLMLDEPSLGLAPIVVREIFDIIRTVNQQGITVLLNEQNANMALKVADYAYVLETGNLTLSGTGAGEGQIAGLQHIGVVRDLQGHIGVLLVQQHRDALLVDRADDVEDLPHHNGGKTKARLVQHQQPGLAHQGTAYGQHLLLAAGEGACALPAALLQAGEQAVHPLEVFFGLGLVLAQVGTDLQIFNNGQVGEHSASLRRHGDAAGHDLVDGLAQHFLTVPQDGAALRLDKAGDGAHQGGFACAVGTDQGDDLPFRDGQRYAAQRLNAAVRNV